MLRQLHWFRMRPAKLQNLALLRSTHPVRRPLAPRTSSDIGTSYWLARRRDDHQEVWSHLGLLIRGAENLEKKAKSRPPVTVTLVFFMPAFWTSA